MNLSLALRFDSRFVMRCPSPDLTHSRQQLCWPDFGLLRSSGVRSYGTLQLLHQKTLCALRRHTCEVPKQSESRRLTLRIFNPNGNSSFAIIADYSPSHIISQRSIGLVRRLGFDPVKEVTRSLTTIRQKPVCRSNLCGLGRRTLQERRGD